MEIAFLGTSSMVPTKERNHSAFLISYKTEGLLFDCGEGTQRQLKITGIKPTKITKILISHWDGDHVLGLPGLIQTMASSDYSKKLQVYGPAGTKKRFEHMYKAFSFEDKIDVDVIEVSKKKFFENDDFYLEALGLDHGVECIGFNFVEKDRRRVNVSYVKKLGMPEGPLLGQLQEGKNVKWKGKTVNVDDATKIVDGKKVTFISDTALCDNCTKLAENADLLVCEATYAHDLEDKATKYKHLTARQAGLIANNAGVKQLVLTHFSQRYKNTQSIEEDARDVFDDVVCAKDFMRIRI
ncbi:MAG: ribonuclease Z [bacterium]|nr:ribonuclease Z [bacterium]